MDLITIDNLHLDISNEIKKEIYNLIESFNITNDESNTKAVIEIKIEVLKYMIKKWITLDDDSKKINSLMKDIKNEKIQIEEKILGYMEKTEQNEINTTDGKIEKKKTETKEQMNEDYIKKCLLKSVTDIEAVDKLTSSILTSRDVKYSYKLARGSDKKNNKK